MAEQHSTAIETILTDTLREYRSECKTRLRGLKISVREGGLRNMSHDFNRWHLIIVGI